MNVEKNFFMQYEYQNIVEKIINVKTPKAKSIDNKMLPKLTQTMPIIFFFICVIPPFS